MLDICLLKILFAYLSRADFLILDICLLNIIYLFLPEQVIEG